MATVYIVSVKMKFAILLLVGCCAVTLARPDSSTEDAEQSSAKEDTSAKYGINESESNKSQESSSVKYSGYEVTENPSKRTRLALTVLIDRVIMVVANTLGMNGIKNGEDLITALIENPIGRIVWSYVEPVVSNLDELKDMVSKVISWIRYMITVLIPLPIRMPIQMVFRVIFTILNTLNEMLVAGIKYNI